MNVSISGPRAGAIGAASDSGETPSRAAARPVSVQMQLGVLDGSRVRLRDHAGSRCTRKTASSSST